MSRPKRSLIITLCAWLAASPLLIAVHAHAAWLQAIDRPVVAVVTAWQPVWLNHLVLALTWLGNPTTVLTLTLGLMLAFSLGRAYWPALFLGLSVGGLSLGNHLLKMWLRRPRPFVADSRIHPLTRAAGYSFPSGHASGAMALGAGLILLAGLYLHGRRRVAVTVALILFIAIIGLTRIYAQVHYPTDVLAGYLLAFGGLQLIWWAMFPRLQRRP